MAGNELLTVGGAILTVAVAGAVALRLGLSVLPLYVLAGVAVGPHGTGSVGLPSVPASAVTAALAELGVVLLLFFLGLEFSVERLLAGRRQMTVAGVVDAVVNFPLGVAVGLAVGWSPLAAVLLGGIVYVSSSAIVTKTLLDLGWIANDESEAILGVMVFEDLVVAVYLAVVTALVAGGGDAGDVARGVAVAVGFLVVLAVVVVYGERLFDRVLAVGSGEQVVLRTLGVVVPVAGGALALGVSEGVAAFFVGMGFATTPHVERVEQLLTPVRDVFAAVFFVWIGLTTDPRAVLTVWPVLAVAVVLTTPAKLRSGFLGGRAYGLTGRRSLRVGLGTVPRGEFSLVIAAVAATGSGETLTRLVPAFAVGYVLVMSLVGTGLMGAAATVERVAERLGLRLDAPATER
ncbi:MAG: cation:proton antiporter [Haloplanus sp.]